MNFIVETIKQIGSDTIVHCVSAEQSYGQVVGRLACGGPVEVGQDYGIEFTIDSNIDETNSSILSSGQNGFHVMDNKLIITGDVETIDDNNVMILRVAASCMLLLQIDTPEYLTLGTKLQIILSELLVDLYLM